MTMTQKELETIKNFNEGAKDKLYSDEDWAIFWKHHNNTEGALKLSTFLELCELAKLGLEALIRTGEAS